MLLSTLRLRQSYISKFQFGNAEMSQLWETFEHATGNRYHIGDVMDTWTRQMGFPVVTVRHVTGGEYLLNQTRFLINPDDQYDAGDSPYGYIMYTVFQKSDAKIQITITTAYLIRIKYPLSGFNHHLSGVNVANFNKIHRTVSEQQLFKKMELKNRSFQ